MENHFAQQQKLARLGDEISELAAHLDAGEYRFLVLVEAYDREGGWHGLGVNSCAHWLNWCVDDSGFWVFRGSFTPEQGAVIARALEAAMEAEFLERRNEPKEVNDALERSQPCDKPRSEPIAQRRADALKRVAVGFLAAPETTNSSGDRYTVNLHTDVETLREDGIGAKAELEAGDSCSHVPAGTSNISARPTAATAWLSPPKRPFRSGMASAWTPNWRFWPCFSGSEGKRVFLLLSAAGREGLYADGAPGCFGGSFDSAFSPQSRP